MEPWTYDLPAPASQVARVQAWLLDSPLLSSDSSHIIRFSPYKVVAAALIIYWKFSMWSVKRAQMRMGILGAMSFVAMISFCAANLQHSCFASLLAYFRPIKIACLLCLQFCMAERQSNYLAEMKPNK